MLNLNLEVTLATGDTLHIQADNIGELHNVLSYLQSIGALRGHSPIPQAAEQAEPAPEKMSEKAEASAPEKAKRQPKSTKASAGSAAPDAGGESTEKTETATATADKSKAKAKIEDVTAALTTLANKTSLQKARAVLEKFGVKRAGDLKADQFAAFIDACAAELGGEEKADSVEDVL